MATKEFWLSNGEFQNVRAHCFEPFLKNGFFESGGFSTYVTDLDILLGIDLKTGQKIKCRIEVIK